MKHNYISKLLSVFIIFSCASIKLDHQGPLVFIPKDYKLYERHNVDLNNDNVEDCILMIKATNSEHIMVNRFDKKVDQNRRGVVFLFKKDNAYQLVDKNYDCFYSENEDGGVYYAPQLSIETDNGDVIFNFEHGRYGFWNYKFRLLESTYKLIEYNETSSYGPIIRSETTIDFLTKEKAIKENINEEDEGNDEVFKETKYPITIKELIKLSEIKDFEELDLSTY